MSASNRILGLDLGTNSIGWAIVEKDSTEFLLIDKGARIFSEGVKSEKGIESSKAAERTGFRSARKLKFRRKLRKYETLKVLASHNMCPLTIKEVEAWRKSGFKDYPLNPAFINWLRTSEAEDINPYSFRDKASKGKVELHLLGRALYHIAQRRGFLSNRLDQSAEGVLEEHCPQIIAQIEDLNSVVEIQTELKDYFLNKGIIDETEKSGFAKDLDEGDKKLVSLYKSMLVITKKNESDFEKCKIELFERLNRKEDLGKVKGEISDISQAITDGKFTTLGQYFFSLYNKEKIRNHYTSREEHYLKEFEVICRKQEIDGINEKEQLPEKRYVGLAKELYKAIFFQRPLKSQKGLIGKCSFEKSKSRCTISHPDFEEYRMWTYLNTIKIGTKEEKVLRFLSQEEKIKLIPKFLRKKDNFNFEELAKELVPKGASFGFVKSSKANEFLYWFNYKNNDTVTGSPVSASLKNIFGEDWKTKSFSYTTKTSKGEDVKRTVDYKDLWHLLSVSTSDLYLYDYAKSRLALDEKSSKAFSKIRLKKDFASLSLNAITKILPYLREGLLYSHAVFMANIENIVDEHIWKDATQRKHIQSKIAEIIENHSYDNGLIEAINGLIKECKSDNAYYSKEAESLYREDLRNQLIPFFKFHNIEADQQEIIFSDIYQVFIEQLKKYEFLKIKRLDEKVLDFLNGKNADGEVFCNDENKLKKLYHPSDNEKFKLNITKDEAGNVKEVFLGSPISSSIKNPMAMRALHQLRKVLNTLIAEGKIDQKTHLHIEMARELNDANKRKGIQDFQNENKKNRDDNFKEIKKLYLEAKNIEIEPTEDDLLRFQLWVEQDKKEIYEDGKNIGISDIIGKNPKYDIEHTIPRSRSQDNSMMNKTLCSARFNRDVKKNKMPIELSNHQEILARINHWKEEADILSRDIELISRSIKAATTKEAKDKKIRRRHFLSLKRDYIKGKYDRFVWEEPKVGFKNSQIPDTGIITKYAQLYLKSYFKRVDSVKGGMVAEFRKIWGIQESYIKDDKKYYTIKDRSKHTHHTIDAITIACMTKDKYDILARAWTLEDKEQVNDARKLLADSKPWKTFKEDLIKIEEEILISHFTPDNLKKQSKKIIRIRGKKQFVAEMELNSNGKLAPKTDASEKIIFKLDAKGNKIPRLQQGDTVRGSLHQDTIYGRVLDPLTKEERSVIRKPLDSLKASDVDNIVDEEVKQKVKDAIANKILVLSTNPQQKNKIENNKNIWMNEKKGIEIKKVRIFANSAKNPLEIKAHAPLSKSRHVHKQHIYAQNDENYCMAIYEGLDKKGNLKRSFETINNLDAGKFYKLSIDSRNEFLVPLKHFENGLNFKCLLKKGDMVLFFNKNKNELLEMNQIELQNRLYKLSKFDAQGRLTFRFHKEARQASELKEIYNFDFINPFEQVRLQVSKLNFLLNNIDFTISPSGQVTFK